MEVGGGGKSLSKKQALERLEQTCSKREMCVSQVEEKLFQWGVEPQERAGIVESLLGSRYVDDRRFAVAFARDKFRFNTWGPQKIKMHLQAKRIDAEYIAEALHEVDQDELPMAVVKELQRKAESVKAKSTYELKMKLVAVGLRKGFVYGPVSRAVDQILENRKGLPK
jgi:regulatory protein